jgi:hypothetical protein
LIFMMGTWPYLPTIYSTTLPYRRISKSRKLIHANSNPAKATIPATTPPIAPVVSILAAALPDADAEAAELLAEAVAEVEEASWNTPPAIAAGAIDPPLLLALLL